MTMTQKLPLRDILLIHNCLEQLSMMTLNVGYAVGKNLRATKRVLKDFNSIRDEEVKKRAVKDESGEIVNVLYSKKTTKPLSDEPHKEGDTVPKYATVGAKFESTEAREEMEKIMNDALDEEHEITWHVVAEEKLDGQNVPGALTEPLIGNVIEEEEPSK